MTSGGPRPRAGRKAENGAMIETTFTLRLSHAQKAQLLVHGGSAWLRRQIDYETLRRELVSGNLLDASGEKNASGN